MPGDFSLGCLLGQYGGAHSFDVASDNIGSTISSWSFSNSVGAGARFIDTSFEVHSSAQGLAIDVNSWGSGRDALLRYDYRFQDDAYGRWFPDITTHVLRGLVWAHTTEQVTSGEANLSYGNGPVIQLPFDGEPFAISPAALRIPEVQVTSGTGDNTAFLDLDYLNSTATFHTLTLDDVLTEVDPIVLHPEYDLLAQAQARRNFHRSREGTLYQYDWGTHGAWTVPLQWLPDSHADLLNWWWQQGLALLWTENSSDAESTRIVRIVNGRQPIGRRMRPYYDLWQGAVELEEVRPGSLVY